MRKEFNSKMAIVLLTIPITLSLIGGFNSPVAASAPLPKVLWLGTNPPGSLFYILGGGVAKVISQHTQMDVKVKSLGGPSEWMALMGNKEVDLIIVNASTGRMGYEGLYEFKEATKGKGYRFMRTILAGGPIGLGMLVAGDTDIKRILDLKKRKVTYPYKVHVTNNLHIEVMLASAGLTPNDIVHVPVTTYPSGVRTVIERRAEATLGSVGSGVIEELRAARGALFIPIETDAEAVKRMQALEPITLIVYFGPPIPGFVEKTPCIGFSNLLVARETLSDDAVYIIAKILWEKYQELFPIHPSFKDWDSKNFATTKGLSIPYHQGAIRFYKEKGLWTDEMEKFQQGLLAR